MPKFFLIDSTVLPAAFEKYGMSMGVLTDILNTEAEILTGKNSANAVDRWLKAKKKPSERHKWTGRRLEIWNHFYDKETWEIYIMYIDGKHQLSGIIRTESEEIQC